MFLERAFSVSFGKNARTSSLQAFGLLKTVVDYIIILFFCFHKIMISTEYALFLTIKTSRKVCFLFETGLILFHQWKSDFLRRNRVL